MENDGNLNHLTNISGIYIGMEVLMESLGLFRHGLAGRPAAIEGHRSQGLCRGLLEQEKASCHYVNDRVSSTPSLQLLLFGGTCLECFTMTHI